MKINIPFLNHMTISSLNGEGMCVFDHALQDIKLGVLKLICFTQGVKPIDKKYTIKSSTLDSYVSVHVNISMKVEHRIESKDEISVFIKFVKVSFKIENVPASNKVELFQVDEDNVLAGFIKSVGWLKDKFVEYGLDVKQVDDMINSQNCTSLKMC